MSDLIVTAAEMRAIEKAAFDDGIEAELLMDKAGEGIANAILQMERRPGTCIAYLGKGNNAGDAIVAAVHLSHAGWKIVTRMVSPELNPLPRKKLFTLTFENVDHPVTSLSNNGPAILLDGLLGIGSRSLLTPDLRALTREMNAYRLNSSASTFAMDLPTGVGEEGVDEDAVVADVTLTVGLPKKALFRDDATDHVGRIVTIPLDDLDDHASLEGEHDIFSTPANLRHLVPRRAFDSHKGSFGRIGILAGSKGFAGAAILCSEAAARAGAGLISLYVPEEVYDLVVPNITPEIMVKATTDFRSVLEDNIDAIGIGPGLGHERSEEVLTLFHKYKGPMVVDADALNILSKQADRLSEAVGPRLLTPHPGEMARLYAVKGKSRAAIVREFTDKYPIALLLKGARTLVGTHGKPLVYNSTGSPGLATGGSGDVLTGICTALIGRGLSAYDAGRLGAWIHGRSAELALERFSEESLLPSDLYAYFGGAFRDLRKENEF